MMKLRQLLARASLGVALAAAGVTEAADPKPPRPAPADPALNNPWPAKWEAEWERRVTEAMRQWVGQKPRGGTHGENEKNYYPTAMWNVLVGDREAGLRALQEPDVQRQDHAYTNGVDFYWCFTLKGQVRKYFYFADQLDPAYRLRMRQGAARWLEEDPRRAEHPVHGKGSGAKEGWGPDVKGRRVDNRNTDNLRAMRNTSMYLMAEEVANEPMRLTMKQALLDYAHTLFHVGMSEWGSPNYHGHALATYHNLYDFAKDPQVKGIAKATLDWLYAAAAVKYRRGGFGASNARDYGGNAAFLANATKPAYLYFGDAPPRCVSDRDDLYHITSGYRPPPAVVELARKRLGAPGGRFEPAEFFATKPAYKNWAIGQESEPAFWETQYLAGTFQIGTCVATDTGGPWNINAFKLLADDSKLGAAYFVAQTESTLGQSFKHPGDQIGQYRNLVVWLRPPGQNKPLMFQWPVSAAVEEGPGVLFFRLEQTWLALRPIGLGGFERLAAAGNALPQGEAKRAGRAEEVARQYADYVFARAAPDGDGYHGFALEAGDTASHGSFEQFKKAVLSKGKLDTSRLVQGVVTLASPLGHALTVTHNGSSERPMVLRDGQAVEWDKIRDVWQPVSGPKTIQEVRFSGRLRVQAGGKVFEGWIDREGNYAFTNE